MTSLEPGIRRQCEELIGVEGEWDRRGGSARVVLDDDGAPTRLEMHRQPTEYTAPQARLNKVKRVGNHKAVEFRKRQGFSEIGCNGLNFDLRMISSESVPQSLERSGFDVHRHYSAARTDDFLKDSGEHTVAAAEVGPYAAR